MPQWKPPTAPISGSSWKPPTSPIGGTSWKPPTSPLSSRRLSTPQSEMPDSSWKSLNLNDINKPEPMKMDLSDWDRPKFDPSKPDLSSWGISDPEKEFQAAAQGRAERKKLEPKPVPKPRAESPYQFEPAKKELTRFDMPLTEPFENVFDPRFTVEERMKNFPGEAWDTLTHKRTAIRDPSAPGGERQIIAGPSQESLLPESKWQPESEWGKAANYAYNNVLRPFVSEEGIVGSAEPGKISKFKHANIAKPTFGMLDRAPAISAMESELAIPKVARQTPPVTGTPPRETGPISLPSEFGPSAYAGPERRKQNFGPDEGISERRAAELQQRFGGRQEPGLDLRQPERPGDPAVIEPPESVPSSTAEAPIIEQPLGPVAPIKAPARGMNQDIVDPTTGEVLDSVGPARERKLELGRPGTFAEDIPEVTPGRLANVGEPRTGILDETGAARLPAKARKPRAKAGMIVKEPGAVEPPRMTLGQETPVPPKEIPEQLPSVEMPGPTRAEILESKGREAAVNRDLGRGVRESFDNFLERTIKISRTQFDNLPEEARGIIQREHQKSIAPRPKQESKFPIEPVGVTKATDFDDYIKSSSGMSRTEYDMLPENVRAGIQREYQKGLVPAADLKTSPAVSMANVETFALKDGTGVGRRIGSKFSQLGRVTDSGDAFIARLPDGKELGRYSSSEDAVRAIVRENTPISARKPIKTAEAPEPPKAEPTSYNDTLGKSSVTMTRRRMEDLQAQGWTTKEVSKDRLYKDNLYMNSLVRKVKYESGEKAIVFTPPTTASKRAAPKFKRAPDAEVSQAYKDKYYGGQEPTPPSPEELKAVEPVEGAAERVMSYERARNEGVPLKQREKEAREALRPVPPKRPIKDVLAEHGYGTLSPGEGESPVMKAAQEAVEREAARKPVAVDYSPIPSGDKGASARTFINKVQEKLVNILSGIPETKEQLLENLKRYPDLAEDMQEKIKELPKLLNTMADRGAQFGIETYPGQKAELERVINYARSIAREFTESAARDPEGTITGVRQVFKKALSGELQRLPDIRELHGGFGVPLDDLADAVAEITRRLGVEAKQLGVQSKLFGKAYKEQVRATNNLVTAGNISRSLMSTADVSAPFRQALPLIHKKEFWKGIPDMIKMFKDEKFFEKTMKDIQRGSTFDLKKKSGLDLTGVPGFRKEERFLGQAAEQLPVVGGLVRRSDRAYTGYLTKLRSDVFDEMLRNAVDTGLVKKTPGGRFTNRTFRRNMATFINASTGRGKLGMLEDSAEALNAVFYSPRLMASRLYYFNPNNYIFANKGMRMEVVKSAMAVSAFAGTSAGLLHYVAGADVELDPRSSDFMKARFGNTRIDLAGGFGQFITLGARLAMKSTKALPRASEKEGPVIPYGRGFGKDTRMDAIYRFFENKEAPIASAVTTFLKDSDFKGDAPNWPKEVVDRFTPMITQDLIDLGKSNPGQAWWMVPAAFVPASFGIGIQTHTAKGGRPRPPQRPQRPERPKRPVGLSMPGMMDLGEVSMPE